MAINLSLPRINPLTKFPLNIQPPGSAALQSPNIAVRSVPQISSIVGPVRFPFHFQLTPISWIPTPFLNKAPTAVPFGGLFRR